MPPTYARPALILPTAMVLLLMPLQVSLPAATSAPTRADATPAAQSVTTTTVLLSLRKKRVTTEQRARVKVVVRQSSRPSTTGAQERALFGRLKLVIRKGEHRRVIRASMADNVKVVRLPRLLAGVYRIHAKFLGSATIPGARSQAKTLTVVAPAGPTGFPDASNTGVPAETILSAYTGSSTISQANTVIDGKILGCVRVRAPGVVIRRSKISCAGSTVVASYDGDYSGTPLLLEDVEIDCQDGPGTAVGDALVTVRRTDIHGCENGFDLNRDILVEDSYVHDLYTGGGAHSDGIQLSGHLVGPGTYAPGALNITIRHNTIYGQGPNGEFGDASIISNPEGDANILIEDNLFAGGTYTLYCDYEGTATNYQVVGNHFSRIFSPKVGFYGPSEGCADETQSGNVIHETGKPLHLP